MTPVLPADTPQEHSDGASAVTVKNLHDTDTTPRDSSHILECAPCTGLYGSAARHPSAGLARLRSSGGSGGLRRVGAGLVLQKVMCYASRKYGAGGGGGVVGGLLQNRTIFHAQATIHHANYFAGQIRRAIKRRRAKWVKQTRPASTGSTKHFHHELDDRGCVHAFNESKKGCMICHGGKIRTSVVTFPAQQTGRIDLQTKSIYRVSQCWVRDLHSAVLPGGDDRKINAGAGVCVCVWDSIAPCLSHSAISHGTPFRDGSPFLLLTECPPPTLWALLSGFPS